MVPYQSQVFDIHCTQFIKTIASEIHPVVSFILHVPTVLVSEQKRYDRGSITAVLGQGRFGKLET